MRALEKDPARRFQSADEFIAALEAARRAPTRPIVMEPTPGEPWVEEERRLALVDVGCSALLVLAALAVGAYFLLAAARRSTCPNVVGRDGQRGGRRRCTAAASRSRSSASGLRQGPARPGDLAGSRRRATSVQGGLDRDRVTVSAGRGHGAGAARSRASPQGDAEEALARRGLQAQGRRRRSPTRSPKGDVISHLAGGGPEVDQGPHGHADRLQGPARASRCRSSSGSPQDDAEAQLQRRSG